MNHLLAKTKGRKGDFFKVISDKEIFELPDDLDEPVAYDSNYKLEDDEWFAITEFSEKKYCIDFLKEHLISTDYNQISVDDYLNINYLISYQTDVYYFQKLSSSQVLQKKYITISQEPVLDNKRIIVIDNCPDAIYIKDRDTLYFKKLTSITAIFKGIEQLYKEATQKETEDFLEHDFIQLKDGYCADKVKTLNRRRIAMAIETFMKFIPAEKCEVFSYIREYCEGLTFDEDVGNFSISNEVELKQLLFGIEQRYYTTRFGNERRLANSVTKI